MAYEHPEGFVQPRLFPHDCEHLDSTPPVISIALPIIPVHQHTRGCPLNPADPRCTIQRRIEDLHEHGAVQSASAAWMT